MSVSDVPPLELLMIEKSDDLKTHQWVYQLLRNNLLCGRIAPGIPLTIRGLAQILDVSPMPVREAVWDASWAAQQRAPRRAPVFSRDAVQAPADAFRVLEALLARLSRWQSKETSWQFS